MKEFWNLCQFLFTAAGGWLGYFLGGCDGLLLALVLFAVADYITGVMCAISDKKLSSEVGFKGICRKVIIFMLVGVAHVIDVNVIATGSVLRTAVIFFYLSNEGVSLLENAVCAAHSDELFAALLPLHQIGNIGHHGIGFKQDVRPFLFYKKGYYIRHGMLT